MHALPEESAMSCTQRLIGDYREIFGKYLQGHQKTFSLHIRKAEVDTTRITIDISIPHNMFHFVIDFVNKTLGKDVDMNTIPLLIKDRKP